MQRALLGTPVLLALLVVLTIGPARGAEEGPDAPLMKAARREKAKIADVWLDLADWLIDRDLKEMAREYLEKGRALDPETRVLAKLEPRIEALEGKGVVNETVEKRLRKDREKAAKGYERLAKLFEKEDGDPRFAKALLGALFLAPTPKRVSKVAGFAQKDLLLMRSPDHPLAAWVSLPKGWKAGKEWPVLVCVDGAGANFRGLGMAHRSARGSRPWIIVSPHALSCTSEVLYDRYPMYTKSLIQEWNTRRVDFDQAGLLALLDFLRDVFGASEKVAITGFSGGGNLCYGFLLKHPERVLCAGPACANFNPGLEKEAAPLADGGPPVHMFTGEKDPHRYLTHGKTPPGIEEQTDLAEAALKGQGFQNLRRTMLPGVGHSACPDQVWEFVDEVTAE